MITYLLFAFIIPIVLSGNCPGLCQNINTPCGTSYQSGLCPGSSDYECCEMDTPDCNGQCQDNSLPCSGSYQSNMCPGGDNIQCCGGSGPNPPPPPPVNGSCAPFANSQWNCADPSCSSTVGTGDGQPNYQCAEFVSRSLASAGMIPLNPLASQGDYLNFNVNGKTYDLLWVSSKQGGPLGLEDYLRDSGWKSCGASDSCVDDCSALMVVGSEGPYSHTVVGIAPEVCDAHNVARYQVSPSFYNINNVWNPPLNIYQIVARQRRELAAWKYNQEKN